MPRWMGSRKKWVALYGTTGHPVFANAPIEIHQSESHIMIPLSEIESQALRQGNYAHKFAVHKRNAYLPNRDLTLEEAVRCVVHQTRWAVSHTIVDSITKEPLTIDVRIGSDTDIPRLGRFVVADIAYLGEKHQSEFIVTESESHWFLLDYSLLRVMKSIEL